MELGKQKFDKFHFMCHFTAQVFQSLQILFYNDKQTESIVKLN